MQSYIMILKTGFYKEFNQESMSSIMPPIKLNPAQYGENVINLYLLKLYNVVGLLNEDRSKQTRFNIYCSQNNI